MEHREDLEFVLGEATQGKPAVIRFFGAVHEDSVRRFNDEFLWLQDYVKPSKIVVLINSDGGSVLHGMGAYSIISSCPIEVDCVIEGVAASMGSVIWAAGKNLFMHDYSILMIHNPFSESDTSDPTRQQAVNAFRSQLEMIYHKRFGLSKAKVRKIMDGEGDADGTFLTAQEVVEAGILTDKHIIKTPRAIRDSAKAQIKNVKDAADLCEIMASISPKNDILKLISTIEANVEYVDNTKSQSKNITMKNDNETALGAISAQLGLDENASLGAVSSKLASLMQVEAKLADLQASLDKKEIELEGKNAELNNAKSELADAKASLQKYQDAEAAARQAEIVALVDGAIADGKIEASAKDSWVAMANKDLETVKSTLNSIRGRDVISKEIADDPQNKKEATTDVEKEMQEKVNAVVGSLAHMTFSGL